MKSYTLEELAKHYDNTGSIASKYVHELDYKQLELRNAELVAMVATLQQSVLKCSELANVDGGTAIDWLIDNCDDLRKQAKETPQQCLRQIQAEAGVKGLRHGVALASDGSISLDSIIVKIWSDGYANRIKEEQA